MTKSILYFQYVSSFFLLGISSILFISCAPASHLINDTHHSHSLSQPSSSTIQDNPDYKEGELLIAFDDSVQNKADSIRFLSDYPVQVVSFFEPLSSALVTVPVGEEQAFIEMLSTLDSVRYVELNYKYQLLF